MALTKVEMWISILAVVLIFAFSIVAVGTDLLNSDTVTLDTKSQDYVTEFSYNIEQNNLTSYADNSTLQEKEKNPVVESIKNLPIVQDVLGGIKFFTDITKNVASALGLVYNLPSFFLMGFGLPVGAFNHVVNVLGFVFLLVFTIIMVRLVK